MRWYLTLPLTAAITVQFNGCATNSQVRSPDIEESSMEESYSQTSGPKIPALIQTSAEERWGIEIVGVRLTAAGSLVDFRYRVSDSEKVSVFFDRNVKPYLIDQASGEIFYVPNMPRVGSLRAKGKPEAGRVYFILFGNSRRLVKKGSKITVVVGDAQLEDLVVE